MTDIDFPLDPPIPIPYAELSPEALRGVAESFVLREGTDYGEREMAFEIKVSQILEQLAKGEARILFDPQTETIDIVLAQTPRLRSV